MSPCWRHSRCSCSFIASSHTRATLPLEDFRGTDRFRLLRPLGEGGMGVVYACHDRRRDEVVALKTLLYADAAAIYRLKQEFRALAGVTHQNLVALYELHAHQEQWFFTMELLKGTGFLEFVRPEGRLDAARLRQVLRQLAHGLMAVHDAGKLHRDLKPSNVLIAPDGRAVILDFGIARDVSSTERESEAEEGIWGTPAYMAPEQADGAAVPASDYYALGVMLFEALTGTLPFPGSFLTVLSAKTTRTAPRADLGVADLPPDLVQLCDDLLALDQRARAGGEDVLQRLGSAGAAPRRASQASARARTHIVGRDRELAALEAARRQVLPGRPATVLLHGVSGTGKSALLDAFLDAAGAMAPGAVLAGRCYVRETVPFKGLDGVIDSLSRRLLALAPERRAALLTPALGAAARLFPALGRVEGIAPPQRVSQDPAELRRDAVQALRGLLRSLAEDGPLVVAVDDFQWGDRDGARLLEALLAPPDPPAVLLVVAFRREELAGHPFLESYAARARSAGAVEIPVDPLDAEVARDLARAHGADAAQADAIVREAGGSPYLIEQMARYAALSAESGDRAVSAADMLERRLAELPAEAAALLEALAVAARPLDVLVARDAVNLADERPLTALLLADNLLKPSGTADHVELYHDRIRESVVARIPAARLADTHRRLAAAMEARGGADPVTLFEHYLGVGDTARARRYAALAAENAAEALAFERAASLFSRALELASLAGEETLALEVRLGDALANAGRGIEAADAFLRAAPQVDAVAALELRRRAADQYLRCGHVERGFAVADALLKAVGVRPAASRLVAIVRLLARRAAVRLRGLRFRERAAESLPAGVIRRLDVCWTVALGLVRVDNLRAADFQTYHLLLALRAGEPYRIARALACEAGFVAVEGHPSRERAQRLVTATQQLAERTGNPHAIGIGLLAEGITRHFMGQFRPSVAACDRAARVLRERCRGVWWEVDSTQEYALGSLYLMGQWDEMARRVPPALREAETHGDRYSAAYVAAGRGNIVWLARDEAAEARRMFERWSASWQSETFHVPHWWAMCAEAHILHYEGDDAQAWARFRERWPQVRRSILLRVQVVKIETLHMRARSALGAARTAAAAERRALVALAERDAARLKRLAVGWAVALGDGLLGVAAAVRGQHARAAAALEAAAHGADGCDMAGYAAAARHHLGTLAGGERGAALRQEAAEAFAARGGVRPDRLAAMLLPGMPA